MPTPSDYLFAAFDQSTENQCFATVTQGIERHRLRIYSVESNQLTHDYEMKNDESITSLSWGQVLKQHKKSKAKKTSSLDKVVLLGTDKGSIVLYSVEQDKVTKTILVNRKVVDCLVNHHGTTIYSLSNDGTIIAWSLENDQPVSEWKTKLNGASKLSLDHDASLLAVAGEGNIELWDLVKGKVVKTIKSNDKLNLSNLLFDSHHDIVISSGKNRIDLWNTKGNDTKSAESLLENEGLQHLDLISTNEQMILLAVTAKGTVHVWKSTRSGYNDFKLTTTIKVMASKHDLVPILWAKFTKIQNQNAIAIARGSSAKPVLETVRITGSKNNAHQDIVLTRQTAGTTPMESEDEDETPNETMDVVVDSQHTPEKLVKALQLEDKEAIMKYVQHTTEPEMMDNTIRLVPLAYIRQLVLLLVDEIQSKPVIESDILLVWLKRIVSFHYQHLMADPPVVKRLSTLSRVLSIHATETLPKVIALRGRVEMIQQQLDLRSKRAQLEQEDALLALQEPMDDSEEDDSEEDDSEEDASEEDDDDDDDDEGHRLIKDEDMFMEEMADNDEDVVESDIDESDASM